MNISLFIYAFVGMIILMCMIITWNTASHVNNNIIFGVTLNSEGLKSEELKILINRYKKLCHKYTIFTVISFLPIIVFNIYDLSIIYLIIWSFFAAILLTLIPFIIINRELRKIKSEKHWFKGTTREISVDTAVSRLKNIKILPVYCLFPSLALPIILFVIILLTNKSSSFSFIIFLTMIDLSVKCIVLLIYIWTKKLKTKVYSTNSKINMIINCQRQRLLSFLWITLSYIESIFFIITYFMISDIINFNQNLFMVVTSISIITTLIVAVYVFNRFINIQNEFNVSNDQSIITDDDEYWIYGMIYNNPNDTSTFVPKRVGIGLTINMATKTGKLFMAIMYLISAMTIIIVISLSLTFNLNKPSLNISNSNIISINYPLYNMNFDSSKIMHVSLIDKIPNGIRTNGVSTREYSRGIFNLNEYGRCHLYIYNDLPPYLLIQLKDNSYVIYNEKDKIKTIELYNRLKNCTKN